MRRFQPYRRRTLAYLAQPKMTSTTTATTTTARRRVTWHRHQCYVYSCCHKMGYDNDGVEPGYAGCIQTIGNWVSLTEEYVRIYVH